MADAAGGTSPTAEQIVEVLNAAKLAGDGAAKVDHLHSLLELLVRKEPQLLPDFLPEVLELQVDPSPAVRRFLADFIDAAAAANPAPAVLAAGLSAITGMVGGGGGGGAAGAKRALQSAYPLFRAAYTLAALRGAEGSGADADALDALRGVWEAAQGLKSAVAALAALPGSSDALRQAALRFVEQTALLLTADVVPAVAGVSSAPQPVPQHNTVTGGRAALVREAEALLGQLTTLLKQRVGDGVSAGVAAAAVRGAGSFAQQRPQFMGRLLPPLLALANSGALKAAPQPASELAAGGAQQHSAGSGAVAAALKAALLSVARSSQPAAKAWQKKVTAALEAMGIADASNRPDERQQPGSADGQPAKRLRLDAQQPPPASMPPVPQPAVQQQSAAAMPPAQQPAVQQQSAAAMPPAQQPAAQHPQAGAAAAAAAPSAATLPGATPPEQLSKVLAVVQALAAAQDATMLAGVVGSLQPGVLADVVLAYLPNLPPQRSWLPPDSAPLEQWVDQLLQLVAAQAPLPAHAPVQQQQQQPTTMVAPLPAGQQQQQAGATAAAGPAQDVQQQQAALQQQPKSEPGGAVVKQAAPRPLVPPPAAFQLQPMPLTEAQQRTLRQDALLRILRTAKTSRQALRTGLAAKLAADADAGVAEVVLRELVQSIANREDSFASVGACGSFEVALQWLNVLYARECRPAALAEAAAGEAALNAGGAAGQQGMAGAATSSGGQRSQAQGAAAAGQYEATLLALLEALSNAVPPTHPASKAVTRLLLEVPALPQPAVCAFLERLAERSPDWCTLALSTARDCLVQRPPSRASLLQLVLAAAAAPTADMRTKAVRLAANRLYPDPSMAPAIELAAQQRLDAMVAAPQSGPGSPGGAAAARQDEQPPIEQPGSAGSSGGAGESTSPAGQLAAGPTDVEAAQLCALYCALCTKKHSLLRHLFEVYGTTSDGGRAAIKRNAGGLAKTLGAGAPALLAVVSDPPPGSLPLVLQMLHVLTDVAVPPPPLVDACMQLHRRCKDAQALVPALRGLDRGTALRLLPALLELQPEQLRPALGRLVTSPPAAAAAEGSAARLQAPVVSPEELLSALHLLDHSRDPALLKRMMQAVTVAISSPQLFPPESLAACISQLLTRVPLPQLFMRTVIQSVAAAPRLRHFVGGILRQLAAKQVWKDSTQWKGWLMCAQQLVPESFPALLGLPADVLGEAAKSMPAATKQQLAAFAREGSAGALPSTTLAALEQLSKSSGQDNVQGA